MTKKQDCRSVTVAAMQERSRIVSRGRIRRLNSKEHEDWTEKLVYIYIYIYIYIYTYILYTDKATHWVIWFVVEEGGEASQPASRWPKIGQAAGGGAVAGGGQ